jgi:hypothetical protein
MKPIAGQHGVVGCDEGKADKRVLGRDDENKLPVLSRALVGLKLGLDPWLHLVCEVVEEISTIFLISA